MLTKNHTKGSVLIIVLWMIMLGLILVTAIAANVRLTAQTVINQQDGLQRWNQVLESIDKAYLEILIARLNKTRVKKIAAYKEQDNDNLFDGRALQLLYKTPQDMTVRIYNLSGKINIARLTEVKLKQLLEQRLGEHDKRLPELIDAWFDWTDNNDLKRLNGAEKDYYEKQKTGYLPRNSSFASVDEIRLIKGYEAIFDGLDLQQVFTLNGYSSGVINPNYATKEVLLLIPGVNNTIADEIIKARELHAFSNINEFEILLPVSTIEKTKKWFNLRESNFYTIAVYPTQFESKERGKQSITAYIEEVQVLNNQSLPVVLRVLPNAEIVIDKK